MDGVLDFFTGGKVEEPKPRSLSEEDNESSADITEWQFQYSEKKEENIHEGILEGINSGFENVFLKLKEIENKLDLIEKKVDFQQSQLDVISSSLNSMEEKNEIEKNRKIREHFLYGLPTHFMKAKTNPLPGGMWS